MGKRKWYGKNWIRSDKRLAIHIRDRFMCVYCSADLRNSGPGEVTLDHYIPVSNGGANGAGNLLTACDPCNTAKGNMSADRYFLRLGQRRGYSGKELLDYVSGGVARAEWQMVRPLNRRLAKALLEGREPTLFDSLH